MPATAIRKAATPASALDRGWTSFGLLWVRVGAGGLLLAVHGWGRLLKALGLALGHSWPFVSVVQRMGFPAPTLFAVASAVAESIGSVLLILGLFTRWAAAAIAINMAVAVWLKVSQGGSEAELPAIY